jgi:hypothetical protein
MDRWLEEFAKTAFQRSSDTAHDLKTPLNIAVLNLELLRMRVRKLLPGEEDARITACVGAVDFELRRLARIFDAYFVYTKPPADQPPRPVDVASLFREEGKRAGIELDSMVAATVLSDEKRMRDLARLLFEGCRSVFGSTFKAGHERVAGFYRLHCYGRPAAEPFELSTVFKCYYTDRSGNSELALATARLIAETYGGNLLGTVRKEDVELELTLPLGEP